VSRIRTLGAASVAALALTLSAGAIAAAAPAGVQPNIVGGGTAPTVSWGAQIYVSGAFNCSGTVISSRWVMTARHCLGSTMRVKAGSNTLGSGTDVAVDQQQISPNGDIALLHLTSAVSATPITLGTGDPATGSTNQLYGWGRTTPTGPASPVLKVANVQVTGQSTDAYGGRAIQSVGINGSAWKGDSGGPELANGVQVGVASTVQNQTGSNTRGTNNYGSVAASRSWIRTTSGV
jgi:secreted trypsin-like serine protease